MKKPLVSIIILNYNGLADTIRCLKSLERGKYPNYEIIIVDNNSDNNEGIQLTKKFHGRYKVIINNHNTGFTGGNNTAIKFAKGKYIILLNNDTETTPDWITPLVTLLESDKSIAVVQPKIKMMQKRNYFDYAGAAGGYIDRYGYPFTKGRIFDTKEKDHGQYYKESIIFWASGAACIIRKSAIKKAGGLFDPIFFNYMEEIDFCWRIWKAGYKVYYCPKSIIYHKGASSAGKDLFQKRYWEHRNNLILLYKNSAGNGSGKITFFRITFELATYFHYLFTGNLIYLKSLFKAHKDFMSLIFENKIKKNSNSYKTGNRPPIFPDSIVINYHLLKRTTYQKLEWSPKGNIHFIIFNNSENTGSRVVILQANKFINKGYFVKIYPIFGSKLNWSSDKITTRNYILSIFDRPSDILVATFWPTAFAALLMRSKNKFYYSQDWGVDIYKNPILKYFAKRSYSLPLNQIAVSEYLYKNIKRYSNNNFRIFKVSHNILNTDVFQYKKGKYGKRRNNIVNILSIVSWYSPAKGCDLLKKTILRLKQLHPNYRFTLVSREKYPFFHGFDKFYSNPKQDMIAKLIRNSDLFLATSRSEGFFLPALEAMACGTPIVMTNSGGINEYAKDKYNCLIVKNISEIWINDSIGKLLKNKTLLRKIRINGRNTAKLFDKNDIIRDLENIYFR